MPLAVVGKRNGRNAWMKTSVAEKANQNQTRKADAMCAR